MRNQKMWIVWSVISMLLFSALLYFLLGSDKSLYLPGQTSHGHYQIELACSSCHTDPFGGKEVLQDACMNCHKEDLKAGDDSHPKSKFTDPRNSSTIKKLDARYCISCHGEHQQDNTRTMGVTVANDFCFQCHADIADDRSSHKGMEFNSCASAGCHNFHDNTALYEDFLLKHAHESALLQQMQVSSKTPEKHFRMMSEIKQPPLQMADVDAPQAYALEFKETQAWLKTSHAMAGVNCLSCHSVPESTNQQKVWLASPQVESCKQCHDSETTGFLSGKHGMRIKAGLSPMTPRQARLEMKPDTHTKELNCVSCHGAHEFNVASAASESCLSCHNDKHSQAYKTSRHANLWQQEQQGLLPAGSGVSCASCHLPRLTHKAMGVDRTLVEHNQNQNLRPNEKMLRQVCMNCHGLGFSIDALADQDLIGRNFNGKPQVHIESIDMSLKRVKN